MKKGLLIILPVVALILISACALQKNFNNEYDRNTLYSETSDKGAIREIHSLPKLGDLCQGDKECGEYCRKNSRECENYCLEHKDNPTCQQRFSFLYDGSNPRPNEFKEYNCEGEGVANLTFPPRRLEDIGFIQPMGLMIGGHVTPTDHGYYYPPNWKRDPQLSDLRDVLSPADGFISSIQRMPWTSHNISGVGDYRIVIHHTCTFYTVFIHVLTLSPKIMEALGNSPESEKTAKPVKIPVKSGEILGAGNAVDFSVHNQDITLKGFIVLEHYTNMEPWKIHTVDPYDYYIEPLRGQLLDKMIRAAEPRGGRIDYDIDGRLIGNWFKENTNGYRGDWNNPRGYSVTHFALAYDALDPKHIIISFGNYNGEFKQFGINGNSPDPADVSTETGLVKYELVDFEHFIGDTGQAWNRMSYAKDLKAKNSEIVKGTVLLQLIANRKLKLEAFPGKTASEIAGFSDAARIYER